jgi:hypothetical protein
MTDYKQILDDLKGIAYHHPQINSFGIGDITQITMDIETKKEPRYTKMYVVPGQTTLNQNRIDYNFSIIILDRINDDYSNQPDVMSDTLEIVKDVFTILYQSYTQQYGDFSLFYEPLWGPNCTPFLERFETILGGWTLNITLEQPFDYNTCVLPISGLTLPPSVNLVNYKLILQDFKEIAEKHLQINSFGYGDITQLTMDVETKKEPKYTRMYVLPADTILNQNELTYNFQIIIADRLEDDYSNQKDVLNDTLEICKDVFTVIYLSEYESVWGATCEPFLERYETILCGWLLNITLTQPFDYNRCDLPELPFTAHQRWFELAELWNTINKDWEDV